MPVFPPIFLIFASSFFLLPPLPIGNTPLRGMIETGRPRIVIPAIMSDANAPAAAHNHKMREERNLMMMALRG